MRSNFPSGMHTIYHRHTHMYLLRSFFHLGNHSTSVSLHCCYPCLTKFCLSASSPSRTLCWESIYNNKSWTQRPLEETVRLDRYLNQHHFGWSLYCINSLWSLYNYNCVSLCSFKYNFTLFAGIVPSHFETLGNSRNNSPLCWSTCCVTL